MCVMLVSDREFAVPSRQYDRGTLLVGTLLTGPADNGLPGRFVRAPEAAILEQVPPPETRCR